MLARSVLSDSVVEEVKIFYSYSRDDSEYRNSIDDVLSKFRWDVAVRTWYDGEIEAGEEWASMINDNLDAADIVLLFVTQKFVESDYCRNVEIPRALENHDRGSCRVIPVVLEETQPDWRTLPFARLQTLPQNGQPLTQWDAPDEALRNIIQGVVDLIASANVDPEGRCRWQLHLVGDRTALSLNEEMQLVVRLREIADDSTLRTRAIGQGSVVALIESTNEGLRRVKAWFEEKKLCTIVGWTVASIVERFGAGLHASAIGGSGEDRDAGLIQPDSGFLLFPSESFTPPITTGIVLRGNDPTSIDFITDTGDDNQKGDEFEAECQKLTEFFYNALMVPDADHWVNLSPDESSRMLAPSLQGTGLGWAMLEGDFRLKRLSASLLHPESETGQAYWREVFVRARKELGHTNLNYTTFQRVWIKPDNAEVYLGTLPPEIVWAPPMGENETQIWVSDCRLKVECAHEFLESYCEGTSAEARWTNELCSEVFDELIVPVIEREVNEGRNFAITRQHYHSMILACWCKKHFADDPAWSRYIDCGRPGDARITRLSITPLGPDKLDRPRSTVGRNGPDPASGAAISELRRESKLDAARDEHSALVERATALRESGDVARSQELLKRAVEWRTGAHGAEHPLTLVAMSQLGRTATAQGHLVEAKRLHEAVLATRTRTLGRSHDWTVNSMNILAETLLLSGEVQRGRELQAQAAEIRVRTSSRFEIPENKEYFERYLSIFRHGVFRVVQSEFASVSSTRKTRTYFSGAIDVRGIPLDFADRGQEYRQDGGSRSPVAITATCTRSSLIAMQGTADPAEFLSKARKFGL